MSQNEGIIVKLTGVHLTASLLSSFKKSNIIIQRLLNLEKMENNMFSDI